MQTFKPWFPVEDVPACVAGVFVLQHFASSVTLACDAQFANGKLLVMRFDHLEAVVLHQEFAHRWPGDTGTSALPKSSGGEWTFPFLKVENSSWAAESMQAQKFGEVPHHYCVLSGTDIIDVLTLEPPKVFWTTAEQLEAVMAAAANLGAA